MPEMARGWVCEGCGKHVTGSNPPPDRCHDCGGVYFPATPDRLSCDRCGVRSSSRVLGPTEYRRLCEACVEFVNEADL